jgi:hypothetical protein
MSRKIKSNFIVKYDHRPAIILMEIRKALRNLKNSKITLSNNQK